MLHTSAFVSAAAQTTTAAPLPWPISIAGQLAGFRAAVAASPECQKCRAHISGLVELEEMGALPDGMWAEVEEILDFIREERPGPHSDEWPELLADVIRITNDWL